MIDMTKTIKIKSDQLNADDLIGVEGKTITITKVVVKENAEQNTSIYFEGDNGKPWKPSQGMRVVLIHVWGKNGEDYVGRSLTLFREPSVKYAGVEVGGIRISHMSHINSTVVVPVSVSRGKKVPLKILPLKMQQPAQNTPPPQQESAPAQEEQQGGFPISDADWQQWVQRMDEALTEDDIKAIGGQIAQVASNYDQASVDKLKAYYADRLRTIKGGA